MSATAKQGVVRVRFSCQASGLSMFSVQTHCYCLAYAAAASRASNESEARLPCGFHVHGCPNRLRLHDRVVGLISAAGGTQARRRSTRWSSPPGRARAWDVCYVVPVPAASERLRRGWTGSGRGGRAAAQGTRQRSGARRLVGSRWTARSIGRASDEAERRRGGRVSRCDEACRVCKAIVAADRSAER